MANDNNIRSFTANDIEKYHKGQLSAKEMHAMEKAALDDPFLADALEGYSIPGINVAADITELKKRLSVKTEHAKVIALPGNRSFPWLRIAAVIVLIAGAGWLSYTFLFKPRSNDLAQLSPKEGNKAVGDVKQKDSAASTLSQPGKTENPRELSSGISSFANTDKRNAKEDVPSSKDIIEEKRLKRELTTGSEKENRVSDDSSRFPGLSAPAKKQEEDKTAEYKSLSLPNNNVTLNKPNNNVAINKPDTTASYIIRYGTRKQVVANDDRELAPQAKAKGFVSNDNEIKNQMDEVYRNPNFFRGRVTDANNNALPFANIINTRDNVGTYSDAKGNFALVSPDSVMNVQVKVVGFENKKLNLQNNVATNQIVMQEDRSVTPKVLDTVKRNYTRRFGDAGMTLEEPEPADGWKYYDSYLANNLNVPETFDTRKKDGADAVEVSFEVNKNGEPVNLRIEKSLCDKCDKEAIRLIKEGPKWKRKAKKGKRTTVTIPFNKTE